MHLARKRRIHERAKGLCWLCTKPVDLTGPAVVYDHRNPHWVSGDDDDANIWPIHAEPCNKIKTAADATARAKVKRQKAKFETPLADYPPTQKLRSAGFRKRWRE